MLHGYPGLRTRLLPLRGLAVLAAAALLLAESASAATILYDISSTGEVGRFPFSGLFERGSGGEDDDERDDDDDERDDDDDDRRDHDDDERDAGGGGKGDLTVLSDDLAGLIGLSTADPELFLDGQELVVDQFSLSGTGSLCSGCESTALSIQLDPDFESILVLRDGALEGAIHLILSAEGGRREALSVAARAETVDPEWNFATPELVSLMLAFELPGHRSDDDDDDGEEDDWKRHRWGDDDDEHGWGEHGDDDREHRWRKGDDDDDGKGKRQLLLKAQGAVVPEPGTGVLVGGGLLALGLARRRRGPGGARCGGR